MTRSATIVQGSTNGQISYVAVGGTYPGCDESETGQFTNMCQAVVEPISCDYGTPSGEYVLLRWYPDGTFHFEQHRAATFHDSVIDANLPR